jgi:phage tail sheath protein FI
MAERIVSPGVFTRERDLSFLPQAIGAIGAAIVGPTQKGPAFVPTQVTSFQDFEEIFGGQDDRFYTPQTVEQYLRSAGVVTVVRVLGLGGYKADALRLNVHASGGETQSLAILAPSRGSSGVGDLSMSSVTSGSWSSFTLTVSGSNVSAETYNLSFDSSSANFVTKVISQNPQSTKSANNASSVYVYKSFAHAGNSTTYNSFSSASIKFDSDGLDFFSGTNTLDNDGNESTDWTGNKDYQTARTPFIQSQMVNGSRYNLFRVYTRSHGSDVNSELKVAIRDVKSADDVAGSDYGTFSLQVRVHSPGSNNNDNILEQYDGLTFDPDSPNYFAKRIGDRHVTIDSNGKLTYFGTLPNLSKHIRIGDYASKTAGENNLSQHPKEVVPMGHAAVYNTVPGTTEIPAVVFKTNQTGGVGTYDASTFYGFDFLSKHIRDDNANYLAPIPATANVGNNVTMSIESMKGDDDANPNGETTFANASTFITLTNSALAQRKFVVPLQWGFDGKNPATPYNVGSAITAGNTQGFDLSSSTSSGSLAYKRAINAVSNPDEFDMNLLVTPGVIHRLHSNVTNHAISKVESRADALYIMDAAAYTDTVETVLDTVKNLDTNYVATYYPWVLIPNRDSSIPVWVPPSVVLPGVISYNDQVAHEWFAPAGLNRGGLTSVLEAKTRLTHAERDDLYEGRVNPIASFPGQGVVVFGQKTLQSKPSALDRINVRRLLIALRKFIASTSRFLVFEQNTQALRNRFLNIVNPYLEQVQSNSGLSAFRVVMDDTNNTPEVVDRNQLIGQIFIQPTRTAEFIVLDFVVQPTGATFPE